MNLDGKKIENKVWKGDLENIHAILHFIDLIILLLIAVQIQQYK